MDIKTSKRSYKSIKPQDVGFTFSPDGVIVVPRASIVVSPNCPQYYMTIIAEAFNNGWITPVAHLRDTEYTMELLKE